MGLFQTGSGPITPQVPDEQTFVEKRLAAAAESV